MNRGSSESISSGGQSGEAEAMASSYQTSLSAFPGTGLPVRFTVTTVWTSGQLSSAFSTLALRGTFRPPRGPSSAVITTRQSESRIRSLSASGEKPPKTMEWTAPIRAQASMATAASGIMGM